MSTRIVAVQAGVNAISCEKCAEINARARREVALGTCFLPVTMERLARLRDGESWTMTLFCHERGHANRLSITA